MTLPRSQWRHLQWQKALRTGKSRPCGRRSGRDLIRQYGQEQSSRSGRELTDCRLSNLREDVANPNQAKNKLRTIPVGNHAVWHSKQKPRQQGKGLLPALDRSKPRLDGFILATGVGIWACHVAVFALAYAPLHHLAEANGQELRGESKACNDERAGDDDAEKLRASCVRAGRLVRLINPCCTIVGDVA